MYLRLVAVALTLLVSSRALASDIREAFIDPVCLWELAESGGTAMACGRKHGGIPVKIENGVMTSPMEDENQPNYPDEIRATRLGNLKSGDQVFLITSMRYGEKIDGTKVVIWRRAAPDGGAVEVVVSSGYRSQGGIVSATLLADERIQIDITFDTAWSGIEEAWTGVPEDFRNAPTFDNGCAACGMGIAHVLYPSDGSGRPELKSIEIDSGPEENSCKAKQLLAKAGSLPHSFTPLQFRELLGALETCPDDDTTH